MMKNKPFYRRPGCLTAMVILSAVLLIPTAGFVAVSQFPSFGAQGADFLRKIIGDRAVAQIEMAMFTAQDQLAQIKYHLGLVQAEAPWSAPSVGTQEPTAVVASAIPTLTGMQPAISPTVIGSTPSVILTPAQKPDVWTLPQIKPVGNLPGEGTWDGYINDPSGRVVAYRTFIEPYPDRPYVTTAIVAFDLQNIGLHYVLGTDEPKGEGGDKRTGLIPDSNRKADVLLAAFNGGFKATHGHFGAMADGITAIPPKDGLGSIAIYQDGRVRMGEWGKDIVLSADMAAWRENGPLIIQEGQVNPRVAVADPRDWGYTVDSVSPTWRSGLGISADNRTLFYFCGSDLSVPALAKVMQAAQVRYAIQLDINNYWVHFVAYHNQNGQLASEVLIPNAMRENIDRYLWAYTRDYFYVTVKQTQ
jgi:hypothetical protein